LKIKDLQILEKIYKINLDKIINESIIVKNPGNIEAPGSNLRHFNK